jgi:phosphate transport system protein
MRELRGEFRQQLEHIETHVIELFALQAEDLAVATEALLSGDVNALKVVSERDATIHDLYEELEGLVNSQLVLQAPVAGDLRLLLSVLRILPELELSHGLVAQIAEYATHFLNDQLSPRSRGLVQRMGETTAQMWSQGATAWYERDRDAVEALEEHDDDLDSLHSALMAELASGQIALPVAMEMTLVARFYERLGDHAVNIARRVVYLAGPSQDG